MRYLSVCSGIEAASVAWHDLGWTPVGFSEIEPFPCAVLRERFPDVPNYGDMTKFKEWNIEPGTVDILVGGTPCQAFSVAGLRKGLADPRGNLALTFVAMVDYLRPRYVLWENVPGVLSSNGGRDFGSFLGALGQLGYGWAYRTLDAQYFGVPQRRRRVFVVGCSSGDARDCGQILFEPEGVRGDTPTGNRPGQGVATGAGTGVAGGGGRIAGTVSSKWAKGTGGPAGDECYNLVPAVYESHPNDSRVTGPVEQSPTVAARWGTGGNNTPLVQETVQVCVTGNRTHALTTRSAAEEDGTGRGNPIVPVVQPRTFDWQCRGDMREMKLQDKPLLWANQTTAVAFGQDQTAFRKSRRAQSADDAETWVDDGKANTLNVFDTGDIRTTHAVTPPRMAVRRLTPVECERLQGFPDGWTDIMPKGKPTPDGPRYKALGNSMAVPVMRWIGMRINNSNASR